MILTAGPVAAQTVAVGLTMSSGNAGVEEGDGGPLSGIGVEVAGLARSTGFVQISRWSRRGDASHGISSAGFVGAGWRLQGHPHGERRATRDPLDRVTLLIAAQKTHAAVHAPQAQRPPLQRPRSTPPAGRQIAQRRDAGSPIVDIRWQVMAD